MVQLLSLKERVGGESKIFVMLYLVYHMRLIVVFMATVCCPSTAINIIDNEMFFQPFHIFLHDLGKPNG